MHVFPATYYGHTSNARSQNHVIRFDIDETNSELVKDLAISRAGRPVLVIVYDLVEGEDPLQEIYNDDKAMPNKLIARIHVTIKDYQKQTGVEEKVIKKILKNLLKSRGIDKKSLSELTENELATAVFVLNTMMHPAKFKYSEYH